MWEESGKSVWLWLDKKFFKPENITIAKNLRLKNVEITGF